MEARTLKIPNHLQQVYVTIFFLKRGYVSTKLISKSFFFLSQGQTR